MIVAAFLGLALSLQAQQTSIRTDGNGSATRTVPAPTDSTATAVRAPDAPVIDGKGDDQIWSSTPAITQFKQWRPTEGKAPRYKTEAKIAYDASNLYVYIRAF